MSVVRIYALAKELKVDSIELVDICSKVGIRGKGGVLASLTDEEAELIRSYYRENQQEIEHQESFIDAENCFNSVLIDVDSSKHQLLLSLLPEFLASRTTAKLKAEVEFALQCAEFDTEEHRNYHRRHAVMSITAYVEAIVYEQKAWLSSSYHSINQSRFPLELRNFLFEFGELDFLVEKVACCIKAIVFMQGVTFSKDIWRLLHGTILLRHQLVHPIKGGYLRFDISDEETSNAEKAFEWFDELYSGLIVFEK